MSPSSGTRASWSRRRGNTRSTRRRRVRASARTHGPTPTPCCRAVRSPTRRRTSSASSPGSALRTRHVDYNGRFCMVAAGSGNMQAFGLDRAMTPLADSNCRRDRGRRRQPVRRLPGDVAADASTRPVAHGGRVVVDRPRFGRWVGRATCRSTLRPGTDGALFLGLLARDRAQGLLDGASSHDRTTGFDEVIAAAPAVDPGGRSRSVPTSPPSTPRRWPACSHGDSGSCTSRPWRRAADHGTANVLGDDQRRARLWLARSAGIGHQHAHRPAQRQGGREWGQRCNQLPAGRSIADPDAPPCVAERGVSTRTLPGVGATYVEILEDGGRGGSAGCCRSPTT